MKKQSRSKVIHIWNEYDFMLYIPADLTAFNKPRISFNYKNENRRSWEEIQRQNQLLKDNGQWNENHATITKVIGFIIFIAIIVLSIWVNGIKDKV